ncbi:hypothetical protein FOA52_011411 [Chlamydomonas sp. UWO 241]|nr:hypothetical protein FOA52_011411 [Chlamydomonas sp. UWO 241]
MEGLIGVVLEGMGGQQMGEGEGAGPQPPMTSQYRGVTYSKKSQKWQAAINNAGTHVHLGTHVNEMDAAVAFDKAALCIRGDRAKINFPISNYMDADGNLLVDDTIAGKLAKSVDKVPGAKKRKRQAQQEQAGFGSPGGMGGWPFGMGDGGDQAATAQLLMALQGMGPDGMGAYLAGQPKQENEAGAWDSVAEIMTHVVPAGRSLRALVPHPASRCVGVLYDEPVGEEGTEPTPEGTEGGIQVVAAVWSGQAVLCRQAMPNEDQAKEFVNHVMDTLGMSAIQTPSAEQQSALLLQQLLGGMGGGAGGWPAGALPAAPLLADGSSDADAAANAAMSASAAELAAAVSGGGADAMQLLALLAAGAAGGTDMAALAAAFGVGGGQSDPAGLAALTALMQQTPGMGGDGSGMGGDGTGGDGQAYNNSVKPEEGGDGSGELNHDGGDHDASRYDSAAYDAAAAAIAAAVDAEAGSGGAGEGSCSAEEATALQVLQAVAAASAAAGDGTGAAPAPGAPALFQ